MKVCHYFEILSDAILWLSLKQVFWKKSIFYVVSTIPVQCKYQSFKIKLSYTRNIRPKVFLRKGVLKICSKFTGEHPCGSVISTKFFIEITPRHGCSPVNLLHIFRTPFLKNTSGRLLLVYFTWETCVTYGYLFYFGLIVICEILPKFRLDVSSL